MVQSKKPKGQRSISGSKGQGERSISQKSVRKPATTAKNKRSNADASSSITGSQRPAPKCKGAPRGGPSSQKTRSPPPSQNNLEHTVVVPTKQHLKWQPLKQATLQTAVQLLDSNISEVLSLCSSRSYEDIQRHLTLLRQRFVRKLKLINAPVPSLDYTTLHSTDVQLDKDLIETEEQIEMIDEELDRLDSVCENTEDQGSKMTKRLVIARAKLQQQSQSGDLHDDVLNLPSISTGNALLLSTTASSLGISSDNALTRCINEAVQSSNHGNRRDKHS